MAAVYCENIRAFQKSLKKNTELFNHTSFCLLLVIFSLIRFCVGTGREAKLVFKLSSCFFSGVTL